jgi:hypothetical protein
MEEERRTYRASGPGRRPRSLRATCSSGEEEGRSVPTARPPSRQPFRARPGQVPPQTRGERGGATGSEHRPALARPGHPQICCLIPAPRSLPAAALTMLSAMAAAPVSGLGPRAPAACLPKGLAAPASASAPAPASRRRRHRRSSFAARLRQCRCPVLRSTHSARRRERRNKVPAPPTAARMRQVVPRVPRPCPLAPHPLPLGWAQDPGFRRL